MFFHPKGTDIHEKRKQTGISEGVVSFFQPFTTDQEPIQCISTVSFTHVMKEVEPSIWLNMVLTHPETLYGQRATPDSKEESETIANAKFHSALFREEDSRIFHRLLDAFHRYFQLFHGPIRNLYEKHPFTFEKILDDFTRNFEFHFFAREFERNFFWNLEFQGLFYCPIDKKQFLQTQLLVNSLLIEYSQDIQHVLVFHDEFYISSTLPHEDIQPLYSYLVGCGESQREGPQSGFRPLKIHTYKEAGSTFRIKANASSSVAETNPSVETSGIEQQMAQTKISDEIEDENVAGISNFGKINQRSVGLQATAKTLNFLIGPQFVPADQSRDAYADIFAPRVYIRQPDGTLKPYRMLVYQGHRCLVTLLFKGDDGDQQYRFTYKLLESLNSFLSLHVPAVSAQLEGVVSKVLTKEDPIRFLYYNKMNMAVKFSNLVSKEVFTPELILTINQMHEAFENDPECVEQHMNNSFYWVVGLSSLGREIFLIFPPNYTSAKVDVEKKKILAMYFQNLYI